MNSLITNVMEMKRQTTLINFIFGFVIMITNLHAQENHLTLIGQWPYGTCSAVDANENIIYMSNGPTLQIYDATDKANPELLSEVLLNNDLWAIEVANDLAFVSLGGPGLQIIDVSNPANPTLLGLYDRNSTSIFSIQPIDEDKIVVVDQVKVAVVDISDPNNPNQLGYQFSGGLADCKVKDNYIFVANDSKGLQVFDMSNPDSLFMVTEFDLGNYSFNPHGIVLRNDYAFLSTTDAGLAVVDISDPLNPQLVTSLPTAINGRNIDLEGDLISIGHYYGQVYFIDISDEENPEILYVLNMEGFLESLDMNNSFVYVANTISGLQIFDITDTSNPQSKSQIETPGPSTWINVYEERDEAFIIAGDIYVLDISEKDNPKIKAKINKGYNARDIKVIEDFAYVANRTDGFFIYDISDLENVEEVGRFGVSQYGSGNFVGTATNVIIRGDIAFVSIGYEGLLVLDISDKSEPKLAKRFTGFQMWRMAQEGDLLYITDGVDDVNIVDISNPFDPEKLEFDEKLYGFSGVAVRDDLVYTVGYGFFIYDVTNKTHPDSLWSDDIRSLKHIALQGENAYIAGGNEGLLVYDISYPAETMQIGTTETFDEATHVAVTDNYIYLADYNGGVMIYENKLTPTSVSKPENLPVNFSLDQNYPNPFNPGTLIQYSLQVAGPSDYVTLKIYDTLGREVATLVNEKQKAGSYGVHFDASNLSSGVYYYQLKAGKYIETKRMLLMK